MSDDRRRVLFVAHSAMRGGAEYCLDTTLRHLDRSRFEPLVMFPDEGPMADSARSLGCEVVIRPMCYWLNFGRSAWYWKNLLLTTISNMRRTARLIRERSIDVVYTNTSAIFESAAAARLAGVTHVWHVHEVLQNGNRMHQLLPLPLLKRLIYRLSDAVVFESEASRRVFVASTPDDRSFVVPNSVRVAPGKSARSREADRAGFGLQADDRVVGFVGQLIDRKNPLLLVRALARLRGEPKVKCLFAGDGVLACDLRATVAAHGLNDVCKIVPFQNDVASVMNALDVLVLPSRQESFGLVVVEAAMWGVPTIACRSQGPAETIVDGETGTLVDQDDERALAAALGDMFADSKHRRLGIAAREWACTRFDAATNTRLMEQVLSDAAQMRDAVGRRLKVEAI